MPSIAWLKRLGGRLADLVMPGLCVGCGVPIGDSVESLCDVCSVDLARLVGRRYCHTCGDDRSEYLLTESQCTQCRVHKSQHRFVGFARAAPYCEPLRSMILRFKRDYTLDRYLGGLLGQVLSGRFEPGTIDLWVPVPSHWRRRLARGFQPTLLLARSATARLPGQLAPVLVAKRHVPELHHGMSVPERREAVRGAFRATCETSIRDRSVCIIDDVTTTGATLTEAKRALRAAGVKKIFAAVLAGSSWETEDTTQPTTSSVVPCTDLFERFQDHGRTGSSLST